MDKGKKQLQIELWQECNNHCTFCVPEGSKVILNNFTNKNIEDVKIGDEVFTYKRDTNKLVSTKVLNVSKRYINEPIYHIEADGNILNITKDHPILSNRGKWITPKYIYTSTEQICYTSKVMTVDESIWESEDYQYGYIIACMLGDGCFKNYNSKDSTKTTLGDIQIRFTVKDEEITYQLDKFLQNFSVSLPHRKFEFRSPNVHYIKECLHSSSKKYYDIIDNIIQENYGKNRKLNYCKGFMAGAYDCEGSLCRHNGTIRIANMDDKYFKEMCDCLEVLDIPYKKEKHQTKNFPIKNAVVRLWVDGVRKFIPTVVPACIRKRFRTEIISRQGYVNRRKIDNIQPINFTGYVYNIQTDEESYIVNNFVVHNCYLGTDNRHTPDEVKLNSLNNAYEMVSAIKKDSEYDTVAFLGGEFFQGQLCTREIHDKFMQLMELTADLLEKDILKEAWIYMTLTIGDQKDLYETLNIFEERQVTDQLWLLTSYDTIGRFHTKKMEDNWKFHMKNIHQLYPDIRFNTTTILSNDCIKKYLNNEISFKDMSEEYHTFFFFKQVGCDKVPKEKFNEVYNIDFVPTRATFLEFLKKFRREENELMWSKLFNIKYRADVLYRNGNDLEHQMIKNIRHKDSGAEIELEYASDEAEVAPCGHLYSYHAYSDCDGCVLCDKEMIGDL